MTLSREDRRPRRFRGAGGLLFVAAALPRLPLPPAASLAWTPPLGRSARALSSPPAATGMGPAGGRPSRCGTRRGVPLFVAGNVGGAASPERRNDARGDVNGINNNDDGGGDVHRPLAREGDWAAYFDDGYGRVYYFNHATGDTTWDPPTPTFPAPSDGPPGAGFGPPDGGTTMDPRTEGGMDPRMDTAMDPRGGNGPSTSFGGGGGGGPMPGMGPGPNGRPTFYETLRVPPDAPASAIKEAYLALAKEHDARGPGPGGRRSREFNEGE